MKIHIIRGKALDVTKATNDFIKDKEVIDIKYTTPFDVTGNSVTGFNFNMYDSVLIIYKDKDGE